MLISHLFHKKNYSEAGVRRMEEIRERMPEIKDPQHLSNIKSVYWFLDHYHCNRVVDDRFIVQWEQMVEAVMQRVEHDIKEIRSGISYANADVENYNATLKNIAMDHLSKKLSKVQSFFTVAAIFEVPVKKTNYAETHIPLKRKIAPIAHSYDKQNSYCINDVDYADILSTIKHTGSTYERTPSSYKSMQEEDLRNTLLAALNATYKGDAIGEAFRNHGKTDICIERENRAAFVAECKIWTGKKGIAGALSQLDQYLTWRDCKTALIFFVQRKDFLATLRA